MLCLTRLHPSLRGRRPLEASSEDVIEDPCAVVKYVMHIWHVSWYLTYDFYTTSSSSSPWQAAGKACIDYFSALAAWHPTTRLQTPKRWSSKRLSTRNLTNAWHESSSWDSTSFSLPRVAWLRVTAEPLSYWGFSWADGTSADLRVDSVVDHVALLSSEAVGLLSIPHWVTESQTHRKWYNGHVQLMIFTDCPVLPLILSCWKHGNFLAWSRWRGSFWCILSIDPKPSRIIRERNPHESTSHASETSHLSNILIQNAVRLNKYGSLQLYITSKSLMAGSNSRRQTWCSPPPWWCSKWTDVTPDQPC